MTLGLWFLCNVIESHKIGKSGVKVVKLMVDLVRFREAIHFVLGRSRETIHFGAVMNDSIYSRHTFLLKYALYNL